MNMKINKYNDHFEYEIDGQRDRTRKKERERETKRESGTKRESERKSVRERDGE